MIYGGLVSLSCFLFLIVSLSRGENVCTDAETCSAESDIKSPSRRVTVYEPECVYYLAPSSIPNSGFGTYTVRDINAGTHLMHQADAPTIVLSDVRSHNERNPDRHLDINPVAVYSNYVWDGTGLADFETDGPVEESVTTFGALANYHPYLFNLHPSFEELDDSIIPRVQKGSPGIGAYSYNMGYNYVTNRFVGRGEELFTTYGEPWLDQRSYCDKVPRYNDYVIGARVIEKMKLAGIQSQDLNDKFISSTRNTVSLFEERAAETLPPSLHDFKEVLNQSDIAMALARKSLIPRTVEWIVSEGKCLDHLVPDVSTLHDAGRGAFAQRFIPQGSMVVPAPVIQVAEASELNMYDFDTNERIGTQLLINYCFSHPGSMLFPGTILLFCPQSNAILINHCSTRNLTSYGGDCDRYNTNDDESQRGPNAIVRWATTWDPDTKTSLNLSVEDLYVKTSEGKRVLTMEIIATRNIYPGDEVFIDYGEEWERAWADHVQKWNPPSTTNYVPVKQMNDYVVDLKTPEELDLAPYPDNIRLACRYSDNINEFGDDDEDEVNEVEEERQWITSDDRFIHSIGNGSFWPCNVIDRIKGGSEGIYSVEIYQSPSSARTEWDERGIRRVIKRFPRQSIIFRPHSRSSDQYLLGVFRQPLGLPDEMIVNSWMV